MGRRLYQIRKLNIGGSKMLEDIKPKSLRVGRDYKVTVKDIIDSLRTAKDRGYEKVPEYFTTSYI